MIGISRSLPVAACLALVSACSVSQGPTASDDARPDGQAAASPDPASKEEVIRYLEKEAAVQTRAYPGVRLTHIRFNSDQSFACGLMEHPGEQPLVFMSVDASPHSVERSLALGYLHRAGEWRHERTQSRQDRVRRRCETEGLLPDVAPDVAPAISPAVAEAQ